MSGPTLSSPFPFLSSELSISLCLLQDTGGFVKEGGGEAHQVHTPCSLPSHPGNSAPRHLLWEGALGTHRPGLHPHTALLDPFVSIQSIAPHCPYSWLYAFPHSQLPPHRVSSFQTRSLSLCLVSCHNAQERDLVEVCWWMTGCRSLRSWVVGKCSVIIRRVTYPRCCKPSPITGPLRFNCLHHWSMRVENDSEKPYPCHLDYSAGPLGRL